MRRTALLRISPLFALFAAIPLCAGQSASGPQTPPPGAAIQQAPTQARITTRVSLVSTPVTVRSAKGEMVSDLDAKDFKIIDNGVPQTITHFDIGSDPLSIVFVVETSSRIAALMPELQKSGIVLTETVMGPNGEAAVLGFNDSVDKLRDFTANHDQVQNSVEKLKTGTGGAKLYDAMAVAVEMLSGRPESGRENVGRRRVMVVLAEANDDGSEARLGSVLREAQLANITIYSVGLSTLKSDLKAPPHVATRPAMTPPGTFGAPPMPGSIQTPTTEEARTGSGDLMPLIVMLVKDAKSKVTGSPLELAAAGTGGDDVYTFKDRSIEKAIDQIGAELHSQYSLSYTPTGTDAFGYHEIKITIDRPKLKVRARPGYYLADSSN